MTRDAHTTLRDVCSSVRYGYTASATTERRGPRFLRITDIASGSLDWDTVPYCEIAEKDMERFGLAVGDIVVARTGATVGYAKLIREPVAAVFASYLVRFRVDPNRAEPSFVGQLVESQAYRAFVQSRIGGSAQPNASAPVLGSFEFRLPSKREQMRIADILSAYDDLIENNRRRIALLEEAARLVYREWFVHFRFPGHEHVAVIEGVPEGWKTIPASQAFWVNPRTPRRSDRPIRHVPMSALSETGMIVSRSVLEVRDKSTSVRFQNGDTLLARITPCLENGKTAFVQSLLPGEVACGSTEFIVLRGRHVSNHFVYLVCRLQDFRENAVKSMVGSSGRQRVQPSCFDRYEVPVPPALVAGLFDEAIQPLFEQINKLDQQNNELTQARNLLLPRLMNGEIAV